MSCKNKIMCNTSIERFAEHDQNEVYNFISRSFPHMSHMYDFWMQKLREGDTEVAKNDGKIIGLVSVVSMQKKPYIGLIAVDSNYQNQGIGSELLKIAENIGKESGSKEIWLHTEANKIENMNFYNKNGWIAENIDIVGYGHSSSLLFKKNL